MLLICLMATIALFVAVYPVSSIPAFLAAAERFDKQHRKRAYVLSVFDTFIIPLIFAFFGCFFGRQITTIST